MAAVTVFFEPSSACRELDSAWFALNTGARAAPSLARYPVGWLDELDPPELLIRMIASTAATASTRAPAAAIKIMRERGRPLSPAGCACAPGVGGGGRFEAGISAVPSVAVGSEPAGLPHSGQ